MKKMTCKELGGACNVEFFADSFEEMVSKSKKHGMEMFKKGDDSHLESMKKIQVMLQDNNKMQEWMEEKRRHFESLEDLQ